MASELIAAFDRADADDDVRVVIVTGAGRGFCAGADLAGGGDTFDSRRREPRGTASPRDNGGQFTLRVFESTQAGDRGDQRTCRRRGRDDDAADGHPPGRRRRADRLRLRAARDRPRGVLELVPAARRRDQPGDGVGVDRARVRQPRRRLRGGSCAACTAATSCSGGARAGRARSPRTPRRCRSRSLGGCCGRCSAPSTRCSPIGPTRGRCSIAGSRPTSSRASPRSWRSARRGSPTGSATDLPDILPGWVAPRFE